MLHGAPSFGTATALQLRFQHYRLGFIQAHETDYNGCLDVITRTVRCTPSTWQLHTVSCRNELCTKHREVRNNAVSL